MIWNWQTSDWPNWRYDTAALATFEAEFLLRAGKLQGSWHHLSDLDQRHATVELLTQEAMKTSEIEGELLDRQSVQSSVRRAFGLNAERRRGLAEAGIADLMSDGFTSWAQPLDSKRLLSWHKMICRGRDDMTDIGRWRMGGDPMQVVSGSFQKPKVHFEAPSAASLDAEMVAFIAWFNRSQDASMPSLARAGLAHLYFVSIHPFEDGNGRIARALAEKALAQGGGHQSLVALSSRIEEKRSAYYRELERHNKSMEVTGWLVWFAEIVLEAQTIASELIDHLILKTRTLDRVGDSLNDRQTKAVLRMFDAGPQGFQGGMSAGNYVTITNASPATARRDLGELEQLGVLERTGERKGTRYWLVDVKRWN